VRVQVARIAELIARRQKAGVSLRKLADAIGISKSTVDGLVRAHGRLRDMPSPHKTREKLTKWYLREKAMDDGGLQHPVDMAIVAHEMLSGVPEADRPAAIADLVASLTDIYQRYGTGSPGWLAELSRAAGAPPPPTPAADG
jgi:transcriptional regulator with XRE-family HTH domain